jgi:molybdopterin-containing oxidoreductase family membrane subunit
MDLSCVLVFVGVFIEKGIGLVLPGFTPGTLGELYEYSPSSVEVMIAIGVAGAGTLVFTLLSKVAIPLTFSESRDEQSGVTATHGRSHPYRPNPMGI